MLLIWFVILFISINKILSHLCCINNIISGNETLLSPSRMNQLSRRNKNCPLLRFSRRWRSTILSSMATCSWTWWVEFTRSKVTCAHFLTGHRGLGPYFMQCSICSPLYRTEMDPTQALWRCSSSWRAPSPSLPPKRVLRPRKRREGRGRLESSAARPSTCPRTRPSTCTSAHTRLPVRSSRPCWRSSPWWTTRPSSPCLSAGSATSRVCTSYLCTVHWSPKAHGRVRRKVPVWSIASKRKQREKYSPASFALR